MIHVFYLFTLIFLLLETVTIMDTKGLFAFKKRMDMTDADDRSFDQNVFNFINVIYRVWLFLGHYTFQWPVFVAFVALSFLPRKTILMARIDAILSLLLLVFIIINAYHLHIRFFD